MALIDKLVRRVGGLRLGGNDDPPSKDDGATVGDGDDSTRSLRARGEETATPSNDLSRPESRPETGAQRYSARVRARQEARRAGPAAVNPSHDEQVSGFSTPLKRDAIQYHLPRPVPTEAYMSQANTEPRMTPGQVQRLLVVLDLNGTLLYRPNRKRAVHFLERPHVRRFLEYLISTHDVMVWSSSQPQNVATMCDKLFTKDERAQLVAVWGRDTLRLPSHAYYTRTQVYKHLSWIWEDSSLREGAVETRWSQANTVLIDDSPEKAVSEPHNLIQIDDFEALPEQMESDVLGQIIEYLEILRKHEDVSAYIRQTPFECQSRSPISEKMTAEMELREATEGERTAEQGASKVPKDDVTAAQESAKIAGQKDKKKSRRQRNKKPKVTSYQEIEETAGHGAVKAAQGGNAAEPELEKIATQTTKKRTRGRKPKRTDEPSQRRKNDLAHVV